MFQFRFLDDNKVKCEKSSSEETFEWLPSEELLHSDVWNIHKNEVKDIKSIKLGTEDLLFINPSTLLEMTKNLENKNIYLAEQNHSDLIPSKYEGGLKIWECTYDLGNILEPAMITGSTVLDLGCGIGLLGILTLKLGADSVHFQDYNAEVLKYASMPNVHLNVDDVLPKRVKFFSGDWASFSAQNQHLYDLIISSETIYNPLNYLKLHETIRKMLKTTGMVLIAAKTYYFGVGGGTRQFEKVVESEGIFNIQTIWKCSEGVQREILKLTFKT